MSRDEIDAAIEEKLGKRLVAQASPVVMGPAPGGSLTAERYKSLSDEERAKLSPSDIDAMTRKYLQ
jgi:hypothetical protein